MRILDRYILKSTLGLFFGCLFTFFSLYIVIDILSHLEPILENHIKIDILLQYYASFLPIIFVQVSPIACLLATLYTFAKLNKENEIIAMRASGLSIFQITKTVIMLGLIVSLTIFLVNDKFVPSALVLTQKIKNQIEEGIKNKSKPDTIINVSMYGSGNRLFFVNKFITNKNTMEGIIILEHDEKQNIRKKIVSNKAIYAEGIWKFYSAITYNFDENGQIIDEPQYMEEEIIAITETPGDFLNQRQSAEYMNISQLEQYIWRLTKSGASTVIRNLKVDLYKRFTEPLSGIVIIFLGIPFALKMRKRATGLSSLGISLMVGFLYHVLSAVSLALGKAGILPPILAASLSHIVTFSISLYLIMSLP
jgi:lipopolysaccharide export system permease protein